MADFLEAIVDAIYDRLTTTTGTTLSERINTINSEKGDFSIPTLADSDILKGRRYVIDRVPIIVIWPDDSPGVETSTGSLDCDHQLTIWVGYGNSDPTKLQQGLWRYLRAITEHLFDNWTLNTAIDKLDFLGHAYDSPWSPDIDSLGILDFAGVRVRAHKEVAL